jgi:His/Glu/Gln/Arg/opine family amino acid ABC transporter permease subunit
VTIAYTIGTILLGLVVGVVTGLLRLSRNVLITAPLVAYVEVFRCTPLLVQIVWFYYALPVLAIDIPAHVAATLVLSLCTGAFYAEIIRGGVNSIERGQWDAARAIGMRRAQVMRMSSFRRRLATAFAPSRATASSPPFAPRPAWCAIGNVMSGPSIVKGIARHEAAEIGRALLAKVGLADKADSHPSQLSGGQRGRDRRALAMNLTVMLLDEVTSAFDPELVGEVLGVIEQLAKEGMTMIIATHEVAFAHEVADLIAFMSDGVIVESGPPGQIFEHPENRRTRGFLARFHRSMGSFSAPP